MKFFPVQTLYARLITGDGTDDFPYTFVSNSWIPPKVSFFFWSCIHGKLNTIDILFKKGIILDDSCILCGNPNETADHLILHCKVAFRVWFMLTPSSWAW